MFNRRFLRIKVFQAIYAFHQDKAENRQAHLKNLTNSLNKTYELYLFLLLLPDAFKHYLETELENQKAKYVPIDETINHLAILNNNKVLALMHNNPMLQLLAKKHKCVWTNTTELFRQLFTLLKTNEKFNGYLQNATHSFAEDKALVVEMFEVFVGQSEVFENYVEDKYMNWEDDQVLVFLQVTKSIQGLDVNKTDEIAVSATLNDEDELFYTNLFNKTTQFGSDLTALISAKTKNWDSDRLALVDMLFMQMALCEIMHFNHIPVKVSINEYLELAKLYSTPNSHGFINGVLDKIHQELKTENKLTKTGRGLVE